MQCTIQLCITLIMGCSTLIRGGGESLPILRVTLMTCMEASVMEEVVMVLHDML